jgi:hypothetical protein
MKGLPIIVKKYLEKSRDAALLSVEVYNKPAVRFKSSSYITLMVIAWTALFHAFFFKQKRKPYYRLNNGRFAKNDGDYKHWELDECLKQYYLSDTQNPVRKNLEFFIPLRNKIEHRYLPELDADIFGECQSMLLNFDELIEKEFGTKYCIRESLSFSLQLFPSSKSLSEAVTKNSKSKPIVEFIEKYRSTISSDVLLSGKYSFKAFLIQISNHESSTALPIQFVHYDKLNDEEKEGLKKFVAMVKYKEIPVLNADKLRVADVVKLVQEGLGNKFTTHTHYLCWKKYKVRPNSRSSSPEQTNSKYCIYDKIHKDYLYTHDWVDFLISKLKDKKEYDSLLNGAK